jgi:hypothetical protein
MNPAAVYKFCLAEIAIVTLLMLLGVMPGSMAVGWAIGSATFARYKEYRWFRDRAL